HWTLSQQPRPRQKAIIAWFEAEFGKNISQSTVSESLNNHFKYLDAKNNSAATSSVPPTSTKALRLRSANWPILEGILYKWQ
ncbi:hypothetical protein K469DRAFT_592421, partial [Zopfia rhizophila CBS 207.26]